MKPNDQPTYVHQKSNHPPSILRNIPKSVNRRLSNNSSNEEVFKAAIPPYQEALRKSGYNFELTYNPCEPSQEKRRQRTRPVTWFNPPWSENIQTNVGGKFLKLIDKHFPKYHPLRKILNRSTVKVSYKCMPNIRQQISRHNQCVKKAEEVQTQPGCNCRNSENCPMDGQCQVDHVVYGATVIDSSANKSTYTGLTRGTFKKRWYKHNSDFNSEKYQHSTTLSTHIWDLKSAGQDYQISWKVIDRGAEYNPVTRRCRLCLKEKYHILFNSTCASLNSRSEMFSTCRHRKRLLLENT